MEPPHPALAPLAEMLDLGPLPEVTEHTDLFTFQLYPYASVYLSPGGLLGGEARDRVAGFFRALGMPAAEVPKEPDYLPVLLGAAASLPEPAAAALAWEHLLPWLPAYLDSIDRLAPPFYRSWGRLLAEVLREAIPEPIPDPMPERLPLALREAPPPLAESVETEGQDAFLASLLAPVESGLILTRDDLRRSTRDLGLGGRIGERRFVLEALFRQDPAAVRGWLAEEAKRQAEGHRRWLKNTGAVAQFWIERAEGTGRLLTG